MRKIRFTACSLLMALCMCFNGISVNASSLKDAQQTQKDINNKSAQTRSELNQIRSEKKTVQQELTSMEEELSAVTEQLNGITFELEQMREKLADVEDQLEKTQAARDKQFESFKERTRYIYMNGSMSYVDVILKSKSISDLVKRIDYVNRIVEYDKNLVNSLKQSEITISEQLAKVQKQKDDYEVLELMHTQKMHKYEESVAQMSEYIAELEKDEIANLQLQEQLDAASKEVERKIKAYQDEERRKAAAAGAQTAVYKYDGNPLQWPVPGRTGISSGYINRTNPVTGRKEFHTGVDIPAPYGYSIVAAENGTVITAGWMKGYGNTVMIDHGNGMTTLYGHNSSLTVKVGQKVSRGQTIAKCGSTGISTGNHCHFEVRINSSHTNPLKYTKQ